MCYATQALDIGEADPAKLRARQKQLDIGKKSQGYKKLMEQKLRGYQLQVFLGSRFSVFAASCPARIDSMLAL